MPGDIKNETPANTYKDLFHANNNGLGVDSNLRAVYDGNGTVLPIQISSGQIAGNAGDGAWQNVVLQDYKVKFLDMGSVGDSVANPTEIGLNAGNSFRLALTDSISAITFLNAPGTDDQYELTMIVEQGSGPHSITWPASVKWPGGTAPTLSSTSGRVDIFKMITVDQGVTWYAWIVGQDYGA